MAERIIISAHIKGEPYRTQLEATADELVHAAAIMIPGLNIDKIGPETVVNIALHDENKSGEILIASVIRWVFSREGQNALVGDRFYDEDALKAVAHKLDITVR
jgi:hypothetical protein